MISVKSTLDNNEYLVRNVDKNCVYTPEKAANILANMRQTCIKFISTLNDKFLSGHDKMTSSKYMKNSLLDKKNMLNLLKNSENSEEFENESQKIEKMDNEIFIKRLTKNFRPNVLSESSGLQQGTSYSVNKGEKIVLCLRQKEDNCFVDQNTLMFVLLHELTHLGTVENKTHSPIFDRNFKFVLQEAINQNIYSYQDYRANPIIYCGKPITDTPLSRNHL